MNIRWILLTAVSMMAAPAAFALHAPVGAPRNWCESLADMQTHEYGAPSTGFVIFLGQDGNINGECDGDPNTSADYDGHIEFAFGGGWLTAARSEGCNDVTTPPDTVDHSPNPTVTVEDYVLHAVGATVAFSVYADTLNNVPPVDPAEPNCGDFESDFGVDCTNSCTVGFPPGLDGTYQVYISGTTGIFGTGTPFPPTPNCTDPQPGPALPVVFNCKDSTGQFCHAWVSNAVAGNNCVVLPPPGGTCQEATGLLPVVQLDCIRDPGPPPAICTIWVSVWTGLIDPINLCIPEGL